MSQNELKRMVSALYTEVELFRKRLDKQMKQNTMLNEKLAKILTNQTYYLKRRSLQYEAHGTWVKRLNEISYIKKQIQQKLGIFKHFPDREGNDKMILWVTKNQKVKFDKMMATDLRYFIRDHEPA